VQRVLTLPTGTGVSPEEIHRICEVIQFVIANGAEIGVRLS
jgi:hypothetical protein